MKKILIISIALVTSLSCVPELLQPMDNPISALVCFCPRPSLGRALLPRWSLIPAIPLTPITARVITGIGPGFPATGGADGLPMDGRESGFGGIGDRGLKPIRIRF